MGLERGVAGRLVTLGLAFDLRLRSCDSTVTLMRSGAVGLLRLALPCSCRSKAGAGCARVLLLHICVREQGATSLAETRPKTRARRGHVVRMRQMDATNEMSRHYRHRCPVIWTCKFVLVL